MITLLNISILCREEASHIRQICVQIFPFMPLNQDLSAEDAEMNEFMNK